MISATASPWDHLLELYYTLFEECGMPLKDRSLWEASCCSKKELPFLEVFIMVSRKFRSVGRIVFNDRLHPHWHQTKIGRL